MSEKAHRIHIRMTKQESTKLKRESLETKRPMSKILLQKLMDADTPYVPINEFTAWQARLNSAGHIANEAAKAFNSGYGTKKHLHAAVSALSQSYEEACQLRKHMEDIRREQ